MAGFEIRKDPFQLLFHNRQIFAFYDHYLTYFDLQKTTDTYELDPSLTVEQINLDNVEDCDNESFWIGRMKRYLQEQPNYVNGFVFRDAETQAPVGFLWVMYPGGNEFQYKIRKVDAFLFDVYVSPEHRGRGLCGKMFQYVFAYLKHRGAVTAGLAVRVKNTSAIRAYEKLGGVFKKRKKFIQFIRRFNFPYYSV